MKIKFVELDFAWPLDVNVFYLRQFILSKVKDYGEPIRWSISSIDSNRHLKVEAVVIISCVGQLNCENKF